MPADVTYLAALGFGGNAPNSVDVFRQAAHELDARFGIKIGSASRLFRTAAIGNAEVAFTNACVLVETALDPTALLDTCKRLEHEAGRLAGKAWSDRPLDLDILMVESKAHGPKTVDTESLTIPHPWLHVRRFVLDPLCEIWPDQIHPVFRTSVREIHAHWLTRPLRVALADSLTRDASNLMASHEPNVLWSEPCEAHLVLSDDSADASAWPPQIDLSQWPMDTPGESINAAILSVLDAPEAYADPDWIL